MVYRPFRKDEEALTQEELNALRKTVVAKPISPVKLPPVAIKAQAIAIRDLVAKKALPVDQIDLLASVGIHPDAIKYYWRHLAGTKPVQKATMPDGSDGMTCVKCKQFYPMSIGNQPDGSLKCFSCRNS